MRPDKLVSMANQIARFFSAQGDVRAVPQIADHLEKFWDPVMRRELIDHINAGAADVSPLVTQAVARMKMPTNA
jgi:formate dehydrogenase subunit delta